MEKELNIKELIFRGVDIIKYLWTKKIVIISIALIFGLFFGYKASQKDTIYTAVNTFMVNENDASSLGGAAALLGQFGFGGGSSDHNLDKIIELAKSRKIITEVLFDEVIFADSSKKLIINHILDEYDVRDQWEGISELENIQLEKNNSPDFSNLENKAILKAYAYMIGFDDFKGLVEIDYSDDTGILTLIVRTKDELLSYSICNALYDKLSDYYVRQSTEKQEISVKELKSRVDSIDNQLRSKELQLAKLQDSSMGLQLNQNKIRLGQLNRDIQILVIQYGELLKNHATAEFILDTSTPFFQSIDKPIFPLKRFKPSWIISGVKGILIGGFLGVLIFVIVRFSKDFIKQILS